jgi:hypothetical protein
MEAPAEYRSLHGVLQEALQKASEGKGKERHASDGEVFENHPICEIARRLETPPGEAGVRELLGAINYIAAEIIVRRGSGPVQNHP